MSEDMSAELLDHTVQVVSAHVANNPVATSDLPQLIKDVHGALSTLNEPEVVEEALPEPAVPIKKSVQPDYIVCLEDGKKLKMLKRHLNTHYGMTPDDYRRRWGLPSDYPMVAPNYASQRSQLARSIGLGRKPGQKVKK